MNDDRGSKEIVGFTFGQSVENIAASEDNPTKRGIFIRYRNSHGSRMTEYATEGGCHTTPANNLRATPPAGGESREADAWMRTWPNGDKTFTRQKPQELGGHPLTPLYAATAMAQSNGDEGGEKLQTAKSNVTFWFNEWQKAKIERNNIGAQLEAARKALEHVESEATRYAGMYEPHSDGRNTFVIFRDMVSSEIAALTPSPDDKGA